MVIAMSRRKRGLVFVLCCLLPYPLIATAGFNEALTAYQAKDYSTVINEARQAAGSGDPRGNFLLGVMYQNGLGVSANSMEAVTWYEKAAQGGVVGSFSKLAQLYARGDGVPKNLDKAITYARRGDQLGDPEGSFFLFVSLNAGPLNQLDATGKPDQAKYQKLAARPMSERTLDVEAKDALYRAAAKDYPLAELLLAISLGATVGDGNRERMLVLVAKVPNHTNQALRNYEKIARYMERLGQTYTSPQLFFDAQASQTLAGMIQTCGIRDPKATEKPAPPELIAISISKPLSGAIYLPSSVVGNEHAYLVAGEWEERWTYRGCGKTANVTVKFTADGMGGAFMSSQQTPKLDPASPNT
jgi:TPR repeat protein